MVQVPVNFTTSKLKTALPPLKPKIQSNLCSHVVYQIISSGCDASYVGQTTRHLTTRLYEDSRISPPVSENCSQCTGNSSNISAQISQIIDKSSDTVKLLTLEALHINSRKSAINRKEEDAHANIQSGCKVFIVLSCFVSFFCVLVFMHRFSYICLVFYVISNVLFFP